MTNYEQGFIAKCAEMGIRSDVAYCLRKAADDAGWKWYDQIPETSRHPSAYSDGRDANIGLGTRSGGGFLDRNKWLLKFMTNQLNGKFGNGFRAVTYTRKF